MGGGEETGDCRLDDVPHPEAQKHNGQKPHRVRTFKVSLAPRFAPKRCDVVGLYVNPPDHAVVISVEAKTRIQALGQTRKPLPMKPGRPETRTQYHKRNGTTCLMAAVDVATAKVTGQMREHHCSAEFLAFLDRVAAGTETCIEHNNTNDARPFRRSKKPGDFVEAWRKGHQRLQESAS